MAGGRNSNSRLTNGFIWNQKHSLKNEEGFGGEKYSHYWCRHFWFSRWLLWPDEWLQNRDIRNA
jgi:hypothetical protein